MIINVTPISIKKLKKSYVIRTRCRYYAIRGHRYLYLHIPECNKDILKYPTLYINKKFVDSNTTYVNRYDYREFEKIVVITNNKSYDFSLYSCITFYAVFESEYLKWKLRS